MMTKKQSKFQALELRLTVTLLADAGMFLLYLITAGAGIIWLKVITALLAILIAAAGLGLLYLTGELRRRRSLWIGTGFAAIVLCILVSLICNYPSPNPLKDAADAIVPVGAAILR